MRRWVGRPIFAFILQEEKDQSSTEFHLHDALLTNGFEKKENMHAAYVDLQTNHMHLHELVYDLVSFSE